MAQNGTTSNDFTVKAGLAQMLKGGVIMDVVNAEQVCLPRSLGSIGIVLNCSFLLSVGSHC
jgi:pyridoxal 5'-phosphate synthase pdxS subunit